MTFLVGLICFCAGLVAGTWLTSHWVRGQVRSAARLREQEEEERRTRAETLGTALPKEIERCQGLLHQYAAIGPAGTFGYVMIKREIAAARKAMMEGDCVAMIRAYQVLKACK